MNTGPYTNTPHVVVLGGGFGGMEVCRELAKQDCRISLIDRKNHHLFQPLLYQVATAGLSAPDIASPLRRVFRGDKQVSVYKENVEAIDLEANCVTTDHRELDYDYLVLALGAKTSYFGNDQWAQHSLELKTLSDALDIRRRVLNAFEEAELAEDPEEAARLMTVVIAGGGPTGVELAGAFAELKQRVFRGNFRHIDPRTARIILVEAQDRLLLSYDESQSAYTKERLEEMGVEVRLNSPVEDVGEGYVTIAGEKVLTPNVIWAAGVGAPALTRDLGVETDKGGRLMVEKDLSLPGHPNAFAIGDIAKLTDANGTQVPGVAPAAMQMGKHVADILKLRLQGKPEDGLKPFAYVNKGDMATIGRSAAVANIRGWKTNGFVAWMLWLFIHLLFLVGFRNRAVVLMNWIHAYLTFDRGSRIIIGDNEKADDQLREVRKAA